MTGALPTPLSWCQNLTQGSKELCQEQDLQET